MDRATPPRLPFKPSRTLSILVGASVGLLGGLLLVTVRERANAPRTGGVPLATLLRVPELGAVPTYPAPPPEVYRSLMTSILFSPPGGGAPPRVIAATSAVKGEGKSEIVIQLAATLSRMKRRVLLIDASRDGGLLARLGEVRSQNVRDLMARSNADSELLPYHFHPTGMEGVDLAVLGASETTALDLMFTEGLDRLFDGIRQNYDVVLIDTPSLREAPDARVFGRMADGVVLVMDAGLASPQEAAEAVSRLQADQSLVLGVVLNRV